MVALAGLLFTGLAVFTSMALATIVVVADRGDRLASPSCPRRSRCSATASTRAASRSSAAAGRAPRRRLGRGSRGAVTRHPVVSLVTAVACSARSRSRRCELKPASTFESGAARATRRSVAAQRAIERAFPGAPNDARARRHRARPRRPRAQAGLRALGERRARGHRRPRLGRRRRRARRPHRRSSPSRCPTAASTPRRTPSRRCATASPPTARAGRRRAPTALAHRRRRRQRGLHAPAGDRDAARHRARARPGVRAARRRVPLARAWRRR